MFLFDTNCCHYLVICLIPPINWIARVEVRMKLYLVTLIIIIIRYTRSNSACALLKKQSTQCEFTSYYSLCWDMSSYEPLVKAWLEYTWTIQNAATSNVVRQYGILWSWFSWIIRLELSINLLFVRLLSDSSVWMIIDYGISYEVWNIGKRLFFTFCRHLAFLDVSDIIRVIKGDSAF